MNHSVLRSVQLKLIFAFLMMVLFQNAFSQNIKFTKGTTKRTFLANPNTYHYVVNGKEYKIKARHNGRINGRLSFYSKFPANYLIGYDSLTPEKGRVHFNKPYFDSPNDTNIIGTSTGTIFYVGKNYADFQFMANKENGEPVLASQYISADDTIIYKIKPGASFKVRYLKTQPEAAVIDWEERGQDSIINFRMPYLPKPNGIAFGYDLKYLFVNAQSLNNYFEKYNQQLAGNGILGGLDFDYYYKSGLWFGLGVAAAYRLNTVNFGGGYLINLNRRYDLNFSVHMNIYEYNHGAFATGEINITGDSARFVCSGWAINPEINLMRRKLKDNVWNTEFLTIGVGVYINPWKNKWEYQTENSNSEYNTVQNLYTIPGLPQYMFYITISYSLIAFRKQ